MKNLNNVNKQPLITKEVLDSLTVCGGDSSGNHSLLLILSIDPNPNPMFLCFDFFLCFMLKHQCSKTSTPIQVMF